MAKASATAATPATAPEGAAPARKTAAKSTRSRKPAASASADPVSPPSSGATPADTQAAMPAGSTPQAAPPQADGSRDQRVREAAYHRWLARGMADGDPERDWLEAEREVDGNVHPA